MTSEFESATDSDSPGGSGAGSAHGASLDQIAPLTPNAWLRYDMIRRLLPPGIESVLEIGCGQGALGARLSEQYQYVGIEPDPDSFRVAQGRFAHLTRGQVRSTDVASLDPAERFDLV